MKPIFTFPMISDVHITKTNAQSHRKFVHALQDLEEVAPNYDVIIMNGDSISDGHADSYEKLDELLAEHLQKESICAIGNHEFFQNDGNEASISRYLNFANVEKVYFERIIKGIPFIFLGSESWGPIGAPTKDSAVLSDEQLDWLEKTLAKHATSSGPIFVCLHQPIPYMMAGTDQIDYQQLIIQRDELVEILSNYPQVIYFSGHSHWDLKIPNTFLRKPFVMANTGSVYNTWGFDEQGNEGVIDEAGSQGLLVEVYADKVIIKGRDFTKKQWIAEYTYTIEYSE